MAEATTPRSVRIYEYAPPPTPRSASANEIKNRHSLQTNTSLTISSFTSLLADLNASYSDTGHYLGAGGRVTERTRLGRIEQFREEWMIGALMRVVPPALLPEGQEETFSDGTRRSSAGGDTASSSLGSAESPSPQPTRPRFVPYDPVERGNLAEKTIKADLARRNLLLDHQDHSSLPRIAQRAIRRVLRTGQPVYVAPGLLASPSWVKEYEAQGWARPGIRWGSLKPDLIRFEEVKSAKGDGEERIVSFEVIEVKYQGQGTRDVIYSNYKVQALFYHLALVKLLSAVPSLVPSHRASLWISRDPHSTNHTEKSLAIRTSLAFVEHHLFVLLPQWLHAVTKDEWAAYEERRERLRLAQRSQLDTPRLATPAHSFLERLEASKRTVASSPAVAPVGRFSDPASLASLSKPVRPSLFVVTTTLPPLPDDDDDEDLLHPPLPDQTAEELADLLGDLELD